MLSALATQIRVVGSRELPDCIRSPWQCLSSWRLTSQDKRSLVQIRDAHQNRWPIPFNGPPDFDLRPCATFEITTLAAVIVDHGVAGLGEEQPALNGDT